MVTRAKKVGSFFARQYKALTAGAIMGVAVAGPLVDDGLTQSEWLKIIGAVLLAHQAVYWVKNEKPGTP